MIPNTLSEGRSRVFLVRGFEGFLREGALVMRPLVKTWIWLLLVRGWSMHCNGDKKWYRIFTILAFGDFSPTYWKGAHRPDFFWGWEFLVMRDLITNMNMWCASILMMSIMMMMTMEIKKCFARPWVKDVQMDMCNFKHCRRNTFIPTIWQWWQQQKQQQQQQQQQEQPKTKTIKYWLNADGDHEKEFFGCVHWYESSCICSE